MLKNILIAPLVLSLLTACSSIPNLINIDTAPVDKPQLIVPSVDTYNARGMEWLVVTPNNVDEVFKKLKDSNTDLVLYAITDDGYENLTLNMADIIKLKSAGMATVMSILMRLVTNF